MEEKQGRQALPLKHANQIIGIKTADGREWLKSKKDSNRWPG
jgi:hypothetical protein